MSTFRKKRRRPLLRLVLLLTVLAFLAVFLVDRWSLLCEPNPYRPEDFVFRDGFLTCLTTDSVPGIDVSYYQGQIDWQKVRQSGIAFAFVRVGYRSSVDGLLYEDEMARRNLSEAAAAGVKVGAYFFSQALTPMEAVEEAKFAIGILKEYQLDLPLVYDWETVEGSNRTDGMTRERLTNCVRAFCVTVETAGYDSMVYFNRDLSDNLLDAKKLNGIPVWFAMYDTYPDAPCKPDYWQYSDKGRVPGIDVDVDLNLYLP